MEKITISYLNSNNSIIVLALATFGNLELLKIAVNNGCDIDKECCIIAATKKIEIKILYGINSNIIII